jgi:hypothetical protein
VGLDDNNVIRIISGLTEGEVVWMTPPLKSAAIEPGSRTAGVGSPDDINTPADTMRDRVNQKLEEANGTGQGKPGQGPSGPEGVQRPSSSQMEQMKQRRENMTPEEREQMRQRFQGQGQSTGTGSRQGRGSRQGEGQQRQAEGQRPPGSERNQ